MPIFPHPMDEEEDEEETQLDSETSFVFKPVCLDDFGSGDLVVVVVVVVVVHSYVGLREGTLTGFVTKQIGTSPL